MIRNIVFLIIGLAVGSALAWYLTSVNYASELRANYMTKRGVTVERDFYMLTMAKIDNENIQDKLFERLCLDIEFLHSITNGTADWERWHTSDPISKYYAQEQAKEYLLVPYAPGVNGFYAEHCESSNKLQH